MSEFPPDWPDGCPPTDAVPPTGRIYRLVGGAPLLPEHFLSYHESGKPIPPDRECDARGLSVFTDPRDARNYLAKYPYLGTAIAAGGLSAADGRFKPTPRRPAPSHATWWPFPGRPRHVLFQIVDA